jgi:hypothetical protein
MPNVTKDPSSLKRSALATRDTNPSTTRRNSGATSRIDSGINEVLQELQSNPTNDDSVSSRSSKRSRNIVLTPEQFNQLLQTCSKVQTPSPTSTTQFSSQNSSTQPPAYYSNAKYEEISCKGIKPLYDGSEDTLIPFLTKLDLRRQHEGWAPATYITVADKRYDLTTQLLC